MKKFLEERKKEEKEKEIEPHPFQEGNKIETCQKGKC